MFTKEQRRLLIELICNEQTKMIVDNSSQYGSDKYIVLEELKVKIKDLNKE